MKGEVPASPFFFVNSQKSKSGENLPIYVMNPPGFTRHGCPSFAVTCSENGDWHRWGLSLFCAGAGPHFLNRVVKKACVGDARREQGAKSGLLPLRGVIGPVCWGRPSRMLKKSASFGLAAYGGSTYRKVYGASPPRLLRPRWTAFLTILRAVLMPSLISWSAVLSRCQNGFSTTC